MRFFVRRSTLVGALAALAALAAPPNSVAAQGGATGTIEGRVFDAGTQKPLAGAQIALVASPYSAVSNDQGEYRISGVPARQWQLRLRLIGYTPKTILVTVTAGGTLKQDFPLNPSALSLDRVVVTGTGQQVEVKKLGNTVATLKPPENALVTSISDVLTGREPGVNAMSAGGLTGEGARIRIRGNASLSQSNEPIVFLDGVRINSDGGMLVGTGGGGSPSRLDDIDPSSIDRIEVLKGAAAATLYGSEASNGVIQIFTKKGTQGAPRWNFTLQQDAIYWSEGQFFPNAGFARTSAEATRLSQHWGQTLAPFQVFENDVFANNFRELGRATTASAQVSGGAGNIQYFGSLRYQDENGPFGGTDLASGNIPVAQDRARRVQAGINVTWIPLTSLRVTARNSFYNVLNAAPENANNIYGVNSLAYMSRPEFANCASSALAQGGDKPRCTGAGNPFGNQAFMTAREALGQTNNQQTNRYNGSFDAVWTPTTELTANATFGYDVTNQLAVGFSPFGYNVDRFTGQFPAGTRNVVGARTRVLTFDAKAAWNRNFTSAISSAFTAGMQIFNTEGVVTSNSATDFPGPGIEVVGGGGLNRDIGESRLIQVTGGYYAQEQIGLNDWIYTTVGGRYDFSSAFGQNAGGIFMPKISLSIVPSDRRSWRSTTLSTFRLRAAIGQAGRQPGAFDRFTTFSPLASELGAGLVPGQLGNNDLKPEISTEQEAGFEAGLFNNRMGLDFSWWRRETRDALVAQQFAFSGGFRGLQLANIGQLTAAGLEMGLKGTPIQRPGMELNLFANAAYLRQKISSLGGAPPIKVGYVRYRGFLKNAEPLGQLYSFKTAPVCASGSATNARGNPMTCYNPTAADPQYPVNLNGLRNANGTLVPATRSQLLAFLANPVDLRVGATRSALAPLVADFEGNGILSEQPIGDIFPDWTGTVGGSLSIGKQWRVNTNFEFKTGFLVQNLTDGFRLSFHPSIGSNRAEFARIESTLLNPASTPDQRLDAALKFVTNHQRLTPYDGYNMLEKGDFMRWRELSVTWTAPERLAKRVQARSLAVTFAGRNLLLFSKYPGLDPEINAIGRGASANPTQVSSLTASIDQNFLDSIDAFGLPVARRFAITVNWGL
ncbi:MAG: SusC/RagA family TonB-linked outer membrane protein [Gemmatimonadaceae bacterium]|nr:SusC/RagA family TonB-linked outer membrane protein [Gemmatimonadaceae bacterium]